MQALATIRALLEMVMPGGAGPGAATMGMRAARMAGEVAPMLPELLPGITVRGLGH